MIGGLLKSTSRLAVVAAAGLFMGGVANAGGSIGGDCCADLEERVAELEATTARKGNRKVSLTVYGQVNKAILFADAPEFDRNPHRQIKGRSTGVHINPSFTGGSHSAAAALHDRGEARSPQIIDNDISGSKFGFKGGARINADLYAGYKLEFQVVGNAGDVGAHPDFDDVLRLRHNDLYIGSKTLGKVSLGFGSTASDGVSEVDLSGTTVAGGSKYVTGEADGFYTVNPNNVDPALFFGILRNLDGDSRRERIRYDTPTLAGFKLSASWQEDETWDAAIRYGATLGDFTIAAALGYVDHSNGDEQLSGSVSALHVPTGLNVTFAAGDYDQAAAAVNPWNSLHWSPTGDFEFWYAKVGVKRRIFGIGATALSVDYHAQEEGYRFDPGAGPDVFDTIETTKWGVQLVQNIDAAAMELYISAWSTESDFIPAEEDAVMIGSRIKF